MQRKSLMPAFSYRHIKDLYPIYWSKGIEMVRAIEKELPDTNNIVQVRNWAGRTMLDIIGVAGLGHDFGAIQDPENELARTYRDLITEPTRSMKFMFLMALLFVGLETVTKLPLKRYRDIRKGAETIRSVARQVIREKKAKLERNEAGGVDILSAALTSGTFSEENLVDQMMTFLAAGHETTASALQWSVYALCKHPEIQTRLREEIRSNLPSISVDDPVPVTAAQIDSLPYLNAFCNEVLRFWPPVPITVRQTTEDTTLAGCPIPKGTTLMLSPEATNRDTDLWGSDAGEFNPERWLGQGRLHNGGASSNYSLLTFLHGPRSCIGQGFAKGELACVVAVVVGRFQMKLKDPDAKLETRSSITQSPLDGVIARLRVVEGW
jgi:cytochrome P450